MRKLFITVSLLTAAAAAVAAFAATRGPRDHGRPDASSPGSFGVACALSHVSGDDPIVMPGMPAMAHEHAFFGNVETNAFSTRASMLASSTTCGDPDDTAAVWAPVAIVDGRTYVPQREKTYYFRASDVVQTVPPDLRVIAGADTSHGSHHDDGAPVLGVSWDCGIETPRSDHPYDCTPYAGGDYRVDGVIARVDFPTCWDGRIGAADHRSQLVYEERSGCPEDHPTAIPRISVRIHYGVWDPCDGVTPCGPDPASAANVAMTLSSGSYRTMHADFWNTWQQDALDALVERCVVAREACGVVTG
jgi:Domain of unknown function (DUF1996)